MKLMRKFLAVAAILCLMCALIPAAFAEGEDDARFEGRTWEQVVDTFLADRGVEPSRVTLGYCNLVTGEEHYYNGDQLMIMASTYKVPLNMYYLDLIAEGEIDYDTVIGQFYEYDYLLEETIISSSNEMAGELMSYMGGYQAMRRLLCPYMGVDAETADPNYLYNDYFSARQMINCLRQLYDNSERYEKLIELMKQAEPDNYFKYHAQNYEVAHKYGYNQADYHEYVNDCAIVYTDEPIAIAMFSDQISGGVGTMSDFCTLMSDYTQYSTAQRIASEAAAKVETAAAQREAVAATTPEPLVIERAAAVSLNTGTIIAAVLSAAAAVVALIFVIKAAAAGKLKAFWGILAVILSLGALAVCLAGSVLGTVVAKPEGDPQQTVSAFFDSICAGEYEDAYACLANCGGLGLENIPTTETGRMVYDALADSYSYELYGECVTDRLTAYQQLRFEYLDLTAFESDVQAQVMPSLKKLVQSKSSAEIYDESNNYRPEITEQAYKNAVEEILTNKEAYYVTTWLTVELEYSDGRWLIVSDPQVLKAIIGGVSY